MCNCSDSSFFIDDAGFHFCNDIIDNNGDIVTGGCTPCPSDKMLLRGTSGATQILNSTPQEIGHTTLYSNKVLDFSAGGYEFLEAGKMILNVSVHLKNNSPQERLWFWLEKFDGSNWHTISNTAKYYEFSYTTEGNKNYNTYLEVAAGDVVRFRGASESGTVIVGHKTHSFGTTVLSSNAAEFTLYQID